MKNTPKKTKQQIKNLSTDGVVQHSKNLHNNVLSSKTLHRSNRLQTKTAKKPLNKTPIIKNGVDHLLHRKLTKTINSTGFEKFKQLQPEAEVAAPSIEPAPSNIEHRYSQRERKLHLISTAFHQLDEACEQQTTPKFSKFRSLQPSLRMTASAVFSVLFVLGILTYMNTNNISFKVAASRAGVDASIPNYSPSDFELVNSTAVNGDEVILRYLNKQDQEKVYQVTQKFAQLDPASLYSDHLANKADDIKTYEKSGLKIYIYDNGSSAQWVNGNTRYKINNNASLSVNQILSIATSI